MHNKTSLLTKGEWILWTASLFVILLTFFLFDSSSYGNLITSLIGATALIFCAKGHPIGQVFIILFATAYGIISLSFSYYGEMITYVGMTLPMAVLSLISWLKNPYGNNKTQVKVGAMNRSDWVFLTITSLAVTFIFYFLLRFLGTANLFTSTLSVTTSFFAAFLTYKRSPWFALAYAANDIVLIILWALATKENLSYVSVLACFTVFLFNDLYGFFNWRRMERKQKET
jgi:nicotinamide mononucleotide transporter PnuC